MRKQFRWVILIILICVAVWMTYEKREAASAGRGLYAEPTGK